MYNIEEVIIVIEHAFRLRKGALLKESLLEYCISYDIHGAVVLSGVGSLSHLKLRMAEAIDYMEREEHFEIVSLTGTLSKEGIHLHMSVSDKNGLVWGGHLCDGCEIYTTAEIVLGELEEYTFTREFDPSTGYKELVVEERI